MKLGSAIYILRKLQTIIINNMSLDNIDKQETFYAISTIIKEIERMYDRDEQ